MTDLDSYFERIGYTGGRKPTLTTLQRLHALHSETIAFENLSPFLGLDIKLDPESLHDKLVRRGRGGYCYEQNLLFLHVLQSLGFDARGLGARVRWNVPEDRVTPRTHMLLLVNIEGTHYIADTGFGGNTLPGPLRLAPDVEQPTLHEVFRLIKSHHGYTSQVQVGGEWKSLYVFDLVEHYLADYELTSWYLSNHPASHFRTGLRAARVAPGRRHALQNTRYTIHHVGGESEKRDLTSVEEVLATLESAFHLRVRDLSDLLVPRLQGLIDAAV